MESKRRTPVVIAAGGDGSRIGGGKPLRRLAGRQLLDRAIEYAAHRSDLVAVALRRTTPVTLPQGVTPLYDASDNGGPLSALASALAFAGAKDARRVMLIGCDTPFLPDDLLPRLNEAIGGHGVALARSGGRLHPLAGLWRSGLVDALPAYCATGRRSMQAFAERCGLVAVDWPILPYDPFFNVNDANDLREAEKLIRMRAATGR